MKILVFSDSHGTLSLMRSSIDAVQPDAVIHLGDYFRDGQDMLEEYPQIPFCQVPGNCDMHYSGIMDPEIKLLELGGVRIFMTHGHRHGVKMTLHKLLADARAAGAQAVLYGHTHIAHCENLDGMWILNPGAASWGGSAGLITTQSGKIKSCVLIKAEDLKDL